MAIVILATVFMQSKMAGYRIIDTEKGDVGDVSYSSVKSFLKGGKKILNADITSDEKIVGKKISIGDLPRINADVEKNNPGYVDKPRHFIIVERNIQNNYVALNYGGKRVNLFTKDLVEYREFIINKEPLVDSYTPYMKKQREIEEQRMNKESKNVQVSTPKPVYSTDTTKLKSGFASVDKEEMSDKEIEYLKKYRSDMQKDIPEISSRLPFEYMDSKNTLNSPEGIVIKSRDSRPTLYDLKSSEEDLDKIIDSVTKLNFEQKLTILYLALKETNTFLFSIYSSLKLVIVKDDTVKTMAVTVKNIYINTEFTKDLNMAEVNFIIRHELMHIILKHIIRGKGRNHEIFNIAGDLYINKLLADEYECTPGSGVNGLKGIRGNSTRHTIGFPDAILWCPLVDTEKDTVEGIYDEIMHNIKVDSSIERCEESSDDGSTIEVDGEIIKVGSISFRGYNLGNWSNPDIGLSAEEVTTGVEQSEESIDSMLKKAQIAAKIAGSEIGEFMERYVSLELAPKIRWTTLMRAFLSKANSKITTFSRPDKRFLTRNMILPGLKPTEPDSLEGIKICLDTSGSIDEIALGTAVSQANQILKTYNMDAEAVYWDTRVRNVGKFSTTKELLKVIPKGGGGTNVNCIFEYFESKECKVKPKLIVVFTDGYFSPMDSKYTNKYKNIIWVVPSEYRESFKAPIGKVAIY